ncbi:prephenate dehydrogenase, partial [Gemmiger formicilis]|nr:prephenate dehydrogenase [Gemmiger formicilis]
LLNMRQKLVDDDRGGLEEMFRLSTKRREAFDKR